MKKPCLACASGLRLKVDELLQQGVSVRDIASQTGISKSAIGRHRIECWKGVPKKESHWGEQVKIAEKIDRVEDRKRAYEQSVEEEVEKGTFGVEIEFVDESQGAPGGQIERFTPRTLIRCPIRDADDLVGKQYEGLEKVWKVLEEATKQYEAESTPGKARVVLMAFHEWNSGLMAIGKVKGIVRDQPVTTNQTLNVYAPLSDEALAAKKAEISALLAMVGKSTEEQPALAS